MKSGVMLAAAAAACGFNLFALGASAAGAPPGVDQAAQGGQIGGRVACEDVGLSRVLVQIPGRSFSARTDADGGFELSYVPPGLWTLVFEKDGNVIHTLANIQVDVRSSTDLGTLSVCPDQDGDGFDVTQDCNDLNANINPDAVEICNGVDDNCDGQVDEGCVTCDDQDQDAYFAQEGCGTAVDCNDQDASVHPGATEVCNDGKDNDCNGQIDEPEAGCEPCAQDQGTACDTGLQGVCAAGVLDASCNCQALSGASPEVCDGADNDCDGTIDNGVCGACTQGQTQSCGSDIGACVPGTQTCDASGAWGACTGAVGPTDDACDGVDNNCDGVVDNGPGNCDDAISTTADACINGQCVHTDLCSDNVQDGNETGIDCGGDCPNACSTP